MLLLNVDRRGGDVYMMATTAEVTIKRDRSHGSAYAAGDVTI